MDARRTARKPLALTVGGLLLIFSAGSLAVQTLYGAGGLVPPRVVADQAPAADRARVRFAGEVPVIRLSGTPYEMGRQHGAILKPQIDFLYREYCDALVVRAVGRDKLVAWAKSVEPHIPDALKEELRGLADGAGYPYEQVLFCNTMVDPFQNVACSTIVASGAATPDDGIYFGRNLDFPGRGILHRMTVVIVYEPDGGQALASVTWPGLVGVLSGMNERGVCGATMLIHSGKPLRPGMPYMMMYRQALAGAKETADVAAYFETVSRTCANNFMVVDATGASEVVEWDQDGVARRTGERGCVCSTNHFRSETMKDVGWSSPGRKRYEIIEEFFAERHGAIDADAMRDVLRDTAKPWLMNVQSMIFLPKERALRLAVSKSLPAANGAFQAIDRKMLFGGPEAAR